MAHLRKPLAIAVTLNTAVLVAETAGGVAADSLSLISDSVHNLGDEVGLALLLVAFSVRAGLSGNFLRLANVCNSAGLVVLSAVLAWQAVARVVHPAPVAATLPLVTAVMASVGNWGVARVLRDAARQDAAVRIAYVHNMGDALVAIAPAVAAILMLVTGSYIFDPLIALGIAALIMVTTLRMLVESRRQILWPTAVVCGGGHEMAALSTSVGQSA